MDKHYLGKQVLVHLENHPGDTVDNQSLHPPQPQLALGATHYLFVALLPEVDLAEAYHLH